MAKALNRKVTIYIDGREVKSTISSLEGEMRKLQAEQKKMVIGSEEYIKTSMKIKEINAVLDEQRREVKGLGNEWKSTTTKVAEFANVVTGLNSAFQMVDLGIGKLKDLAKSAAELDDVYADVMKTTGLTHDQVEKLNEAFSKMDTRTSREQLNQLAYEAGKLGISSEESIKGFVSAADKINIALGDVLGEGAMVTIGKLSGVYAKSTKQLADSAGDIEAQMLKIGSAVNMLGQSSTANEQYLVEFLGRLGGVATQAGLSADQILGFASALDQDMQKLEMSATAFQRLIGEMIKRPEQFVKAAGVPLQEFQHMLETDMNGAIIKVLDGFNKMGGYTELMPLFKDMGLDGQRAAAAVSAMASSLDKVAEAQAIANRELTTGNSVINEFNVKNNTMQAQAEKAKKRFEDMRIELGNELYPVLIHLQRTGSVLMKGVAGFVQLIKENKAILPGLIALMANWVRVKTLAFVASGKFQGSIKSLLGIEKLQAHQMDVQTAKTLKKVAAEEQEKLKSIQMQLAIEKENLARQQNSSLIEVQRLAAITRNKVYNLEVAATNQATVATNANTAAVKAQKAAFASTPWGLIITALTSIAALTIQIVRNTSNWKVGEAIKEAGRQAGEAEGKILVLIDRLRGAKEGSEEYATALGELKRDYPEIIQLHLNEKGAINNLEAAYKDLSAAARQSAYDRVYAEKTAEAYGELAETVADVTEDVNNRIKWEGDPSEAVKEYVRNYVSEMVRLISEGKKTSDQALQEIEDHIAKYGAYVSHSHGDIGRSAYARTRSDLLEVQVAYKDTMEIVEKYKAALKPDQKSEDPWGLQKKSLEELEAMLKEVNEAKKTAGSVLELRELIAKSEAITKQIEKLKPKTETTTTTVTGETEAERKAREKREKAQAKAEAAWTRFSNSYEQAMSKINAKTLSGIEAIGAEIDATTQKMRTDLEAVDKTLHPEAAQKLKDLEEASEAWKRAKIDEYIAKTNKELDKLAKSAAKTGDGKQIDKVRKATADLEEKLHSIDDAILQLTFDQAALFSKTDEASVRQLHDINEQIEAYKRLRQAMVASVFAEIAPEAKRPFKKQEDNRVSLSYQENYTRALTATQAEVEKYTKALEDALAAEQEMARVARENGNLEEAEKHEKNAEAIQHETENLEELNDEAKKLAKEDAMSKTLDKWAETMEEFGGKALSIFSNINTMLKNQAQQRLNDLEDEKDDQIKVLDQQFEQGLISEEQYNTRKQELEDNYKAQALEAEKEDWRRQKVYGWSEAIINAAVATTKLWAGEGTTAYKLAMSSLLAAEMATQIAAIESQPEPRAKGGYVNNNRLYRVGERGREWIASNSLLTNPTTAPLIQALEAYQRGNTRALGDIPMARLNMPVALAAARELGSRTTGSGSTGRMTASKGDEMLKVMTELASYLEDPKNRQAIISHRTQTDFSNNDSFLYNHARLG
jgi:TP901 family phage tail tape measure protein